MAHRTTVAATLLNCLMLLPTTLPAATPYAVTDLGTLPGHDRSIAYGINAAGQVVGMSYSDLSTSRAFVWSNGTMTNLGTLDNGPSSVAYSINSSGQIVGSSALPGSTGRGFLYQSGSLTPVATNGAWSDAHDINDAGQIVGRYGIGNAFGDYHAYLQTGNAMTDLGVLGGFNSQANAINSAGHVVGFSDAPNGALNAVPFLYDGTLNLLAGPFPPGSQFGSAADINDNGQIVAWGPSSPPHGFLNDHGTITLLEPVGGPWTQTTPAALNNLGQVVGTARKGGPEIPFLYDPAAASSTSTPSSSPTPPAPSNSSPSTTSTTPV